MAYDVIVKAHPELEEALEFSLAAVVDMGGTCTSPVRLVAERLLEFNSRLDVHRHSRGGARGDDVRDSAASRGTRASDDAGARLDGGGFVHTSRDAAAGSDSRCSSGHGDADSPAPAVTGGGWPTTTDRSGGDGGGGGGVDGGSGSVRRPRGRTSLLLVGQPPGTPTLPPPSSAASAAGMDDCASSDCEDDVSATGTATVAGGGGLARSTTGSSSSLLSEGAAEEEARRRRAHASHGRRMVVFSEPVRLDADWRPVSVPKSDAQRAEIGAVMAANILFMGVEPDAAAVIVDAMAPREFACGDVIIRQGDPGDFYYVLSAGACDITVDGELVLRARPGMGFGELALLYDAPRAASVTVTSPDGARCWALDRPTFKQVLIGATLRKRGMYEAFLRGVPLFSTLTTGELLTIADALQPVQVSAGDRVVVEGDTHADRFYIVESGELKAEIAGVPGEVCARLTRGGYFGERALIKDEPRAATVTAVTDGKCLAMDRAAFTRLLGPLTGLLARSEEAYARYVTAARGSRASVSGGSASADVPAPSGGSSS